MLLNMRLQHHKGLRVRSSGWLLQHSSMNTDVCNVVLLWKRLNHLTRQHVCIFHAGVHRGRGLWWRQNVINVFDIQCIIHTPIGFIHIVHLRCSLRQLKLCLCQRQSLRHRKDRRVGYWENVYPPVEILRHNSGRNIWPNCIRIWHGIKGEDFRK